jgi:2-polyprenyl-3-methyl-5-hydroxy-6-metoxy-1,4-benzoquinol methylase
MNQDNAPAAQLDSISDASSSSTTAGVLDAGQFHWAQQYDYSPSEYERRRRRYLWNYRLLLDLPRTSKILDIGCGGGFFLNFLQKAGYKCCSGIDLDPVAIEACHRHVTDRAFCVDATTFLGESSEKFDLIVSNHVIEHFPRPRALELLCAMKARLSNDGGICITVPNAMTPWAGFHLYNDPTHVRLYTPQTLEELLLEAGLKRISVRGEGPAPYDVPTLGRYLLWRIRRRWLSFLFAVDVGAGRTKRIQLLFEQGLIARGHRKG